MKLIALCLFAFCCCSSVGSVTNGIERSQESRKLEQVLRHLKKMNESLQQSEQLLHTPPQNIEDCCCLPALHCFRDNLPKQINGAEKKRVKLYRSLNNLNGKGLMFCDSGNATPTCQACASHPKQNTTIFFNRLETLIQRVITRLSTN